MEGRIEVISKQELLDVKQGNIDTLNNIHKFAYNALTLCLSKDLDRLKKQIVSLMNYVSDELDMRIEDIKEETQPSQK